MDHDLMDLEALDAGDVALVGGKGAQLGELSRIADVRVPPGFCVTTGAYARVLAGAPTMEEHLRRLARLEPDDLEAIASASQGVRAVIEAVEVPAPLVAAIGRALARFGEEVGYAVRSSATAEDLPTASFAGQHDTYLDVRGRAAIVEHVRRCWASLFTERAVSYRLRHGIDHRQVRMAVVVQRMVDPRVAGLLFTADPLNGDRRTTCVEAGVGLGEALVAGQVDADRYRVRDGAIVARTVGDAGTARRGAPSSGTERRTTGSRGQRASALTDAEVLQLDALGRRIERHAGSPQDIEWCLDHDGVHVVQSRPITTLFPVPATTDGSRHVYVSVGHQQMMTDPMRRLGVSVWLLTSPAPMSEAGGRLFVDVTAALASPTGRAGLIEGLGRSDPLIGDALRTIAARGDVPEAPAEPAATALPKPPPLDADASIVSELVERRRASLAALQREIRTRRGPELVDFIEADITELRRLLFDPLSHQVVTTAMDATSWLDEHLEAWLGERNAADTLARSAPGNVTSQMGLALLDVADAVRPHRQVAAFLRTVGDDDAFLDELPTLPGGDEARDAIRGFLAAYGMRCVGEIDITRPRWSERPAALVPALVQNVDNFPPGEARRRLDRGLREAQGKQRELVARLRGLPDAERKVDQATQAIARLRTFIGYREYPKYHMVGRYFAYKQALLEEAARLVRVGVLREPEAIYHLTLDELREVLRAGEADAQLIDRRAEAFEAYHALTPPRVLTSDGEVVTGAYRRDDVPDGALVGLAVSAGTVEGRARVVGDISQARLEPGDVLVTAATDPSWTPTFVTIAGLVTEVGGLMTHGAVIAREYGLPAVVGVEDATRRIEDGQRVRVHGTDWYVELLT